RLPVHGVVADLRVVHPSEEAAVPELRIGEEILRPLDDAGADAGRLQSLGQLERLLCGGPAGDQLVKLGFVALAGPERGEARVGRRLPMPECLAERAPFRVGYDGEREPAVIAPAAIGAVRRRVVLAV